MNRRFFMTIVIVLTGLGLPGGLVFGWQASGSAEAGPRLLVSSPPVVAPQWPPQVDMAPTLPLTATATSSPTAAAPSATASGTSATAPNSTGTPPVVPSATVTTVAAATATPTASQTSSTMPAIYTARSFRFEIALETRRNGVLQAAETFSGEKTGEDYHFSGTYRDDEGTVNENEYVLAGGKVFHRSASKVSEEVIGPPIDQAPWSEVDEKTHTILPKELVEAAVGGQHSIGGPGFAPPALDPPLSTLADTVEAIELGHTGRFSEARAHVEKRSGRLVKVEAKQEFPVAPGIEMVLAATMRLSDFDAPVTVSAPAVEAGTGISETIQPER